MNRHNLTHNALTWPLKIDGANYTITAGTGDTLTSEAIDTLGYEGARVVINFGAIVNTAVLAAKLQYSVDNVIAYADITGATAGWTEGADAGANDHDFQQIILDVYRMKRYLKLVVTRATANITLYSATVELYLPQNAAVTKSTRVGAQTVILSP